MTYAEKLKHPLWQKKRLQVLERDKFTCCACDDKETSLQIHHLRYTASEPHDEPTVNLATLCEHCHKILETYKANRKKVLSLRKLKYVDSDVVMFIIKCDDGNMYFDDLNNGSIKMLFGMSQEKFFSCAEHLKL